MIHEQCHWGHSIWQWIGALCWIHRLPHLLLLCKTWPARSVHIYITLNSGTSDVNQFILDNFRSVYGIPRGGLVMVSKNFITLLENEPAPWSFHRCLIHFLVHWSAQYCHLDDLKEQAPASHTSQLAVVTLSLFYCFTWFSGPVHWAE